MNVIRTTLPEVLMFEPKVFGDARGFFYESFNERSFHAALQAAAADVNVDVDVDADADAGAGAGAGASVATAMAPPRFVQDNHSRSARNVLRGLHYQIRQPQGKLVRVIAGEVFDVAVDMRRSSPRFGHWTGMHLSASNQRQAWVPPGFAHGFVVLSESAEFLYKTTDYWAPEHERCVAWDDPAIGIDWPLDGVPLLSAKDQGGVLLAAAEVFP